jgi:hypothetical protein
VQVVSTLVFAQLQRVKVMSDVLLTLTGINKKKKNKHAGKPENRENNKLKY